MDDQPLRSISPAGAKLLGQSEREDRFCGRRRVSAVVLAGLCAAINPHPSRTWSGGLGSLTERPVQVSAMVQTGYLAPTSTPTAAQSNCCYVHSHYGCDTPACQACVEEKDAGFCGWSLQWDDACVTTAKTECRTECPCGSTITPTASYTFTITPTRSPSATKTPATTAAVPTPTATPILTTCVGDCNETGTVTVDDLLMMVNIALGNDDVSSCSTGDVNQDGQITIDEILTAVDHALTGCPAGPVLRVTGTCVELNDAHCRPGALITVARCRTINARQCAADSSLQRVLAPIEPGTNVVTAGGAFDFEVDARLEPPEQGDFPLHTQVDLGTGQGPDTIDIAPIGVSAGGAGIARKGLESGVVSSETRLNTVVDLASSAMVTLLADLSESNPPPGGDNLDQLNASARTATGGLNAKISAATPSGVAPATFPETAVLYTGQVEASPPVRSLLLLGVQNYVAARFSPPFVCEEDSGQLPIVDAPGGIAQVLFSSSIEARVGGVEKTEMVVAYQLWRRYADGTVAIQYCNSRTLATTCAGYVPTGINRSFSGSTFYFDMSDGSPGEGATYIVKQRISTAQASFSLPCTQPTCLQNQCTFRVVIR